MWCDYPNSALVAGMLLFLVMLLAVMMLGVGYLAGRQWQYRKDAPRLDELDRLNLHSHAMMTGPHAD